MCAGVYVRDIGMAYDGRSLFDGVTVDILSGRRVAVTGPNGSGKTTFLKVVAGLTRPTEGEVSIELADGQVARTMGDRRLLVGYAGPDVNPYEELSSSENLAFYGCIRGAAAETQDELLDRVDIRRSKRNDPLRTFSSGMRQRVRLAISMLGNPIVLIWDEPSAMLDGAGREIVADLLKRHADSGGVALVATNDPGEIDGWGDGSIHFGG